jgi:hypothetical protein
MTSRLGLKFWLVLAMGAALAVPAFTTYPGDDRGPRVFWTVVSLFLLWRVSRRSNLAQVVFGVMAAAGFVVFALALLGDITRDGAALTALYGVELAAMLAPPVKAWTRRSRSVRVPESVTAS